MQTFLNIFDHSLPHCLQLTSFPPPQSKFHSHFNYFKVNSRAKTKKSLSFVTNVLKNLDVHNSETLRNSCLQTYAFDKNPLPLACS